jgi:hypothetical protein
MLYTGIVRRSDRRASIAAAAVACESLIFAVNGFRCPLTDLAESLGASNGAVVDVFLPAWFANTPLTHGAAVRARGAAASAQSAHRRAATRPGRGSSRPAVKRHRWIPSQALRRGWMRRGWMRHGWMRPLRRLGSARCRPESGFLSATVWLVGQPSAVPATNRAFLMVERESVRGS